MSQIEQRTEDRYVARGEDRPGFVQRFHEHRAAQLAQDIAPTPRTVLEVGPGEGLLARMLVERGNTYHGLDISTSAAAALVAEGFDVQVGQVPPFPDGAPVDVLVASHVIEHMPGPREVVDFLQGAASRLSPDGRIFLLYPDARRFGFDFWESDYTHTWPSTARRVEQAASDAGLVVVSHSRRCVTLRGVLGDVVLAVSRLLPLRLLERLDPSRAELWYRGRLLFVPEVLTEIKAGGEG